MPGSRVTVERVNLTRGNALILSDVSFSAAPGEFVALTGPSGSGKTSLLQLIGSLDRPTSGTIMVDDVAVHALTRPTHFRRETVGFVFQLHYLLPALTVQENVELTLVAAKMHKRERAERALALLDEVSLTGRQHDMPAALSGGERQRVAIARALAAQPRLLLADEPTGALDSVSSRKIWDLLMSVRENHGTTVIVASHDQSLSQYADHTMTMVDGYLTDGAEQPQREVA